LADNPVASGKLGKSDEQDDLEFYFSFRVAPLVGLRIPAIFGIETPPDARCTALKICAVPLTKRNKLKKTTLGMRHWPLAMIPRHRF
jgi:hypothetical protein